MTSETARPTHEPLEPDRLTWAVLLGRWTDFARSAVALPEDGEGGRVRQSVTDIITLQAVWFALGGLEELPPDERAIGLDRAGVLIRRHTQALHERFADEEMPTGLTDLIAGVQEAYASARL